MKSVVLDKFLYIKEYIKYAVKVSRTEKKVYKKEVVGRSIVQTDKKV